jgi:hypothetical protein
VFSIYDVNGNALKPYPTIIGNGIADDTAALQELVNSEKDIHLPANLTIKLTSSILINVDKCKLFDGGNSTFVIGGDFPAFSLSGSLTSSMTANPNTLDAGIVQGEAVFKIANCKIRSSNTSAGTGISISGCFKTKIENCYIYNLKTGIAVANQNRDLIISNNHIYGCLLYGLHIQSTANLHQFNVVGNMISYCKFCIYLDNPVQIANFQCVGNDIEISTYPTENLGTFRAIVIESGNTKSGQLSEIELCGNTIQGHSQSVSIIEISGGTNRYVELVSICGNQISNATGNLVVLSKVKSVACSGNTFKVGIYAFSIANSQIVSIVGNCSDGLTGLVTQSGTNTTVVIENNAVQS